MKKSLILISTAAFLAACGQSSSDQVKPIQAQQQPQAAPGAPATAPAAPVVVQQESSGWMPAIAGAALGYMLGSSGNRQQPPAVTREIIREVPAPSRDRSFFTPSKPPLTPPAVTPPKPVATPAPVAPPKSVVPPTNSPNYSAKPQNSGGYSSSSSYKAPSYSFSPSRSTSSGRR